MTELFIPDPEGNPEEEAELTYRLQEAVHEFVDNGLGKCIEPVRKFCYEHKVTDYHNPCNADKWSVLHIDKDADFRSRHDHGGGDCMCFEGQDDDW